MCKIELWILLFFCRPPPPSPFRPLPCRTTSDSCRLVVGQLIFSWSRREREREESSLPRLHPQTRPAHTLLHIVAPTSVLSSLSLSLILSLWYRGAGQSWQVLADTHRVCDTAHVGFITDPLPPPPAHRSEEKIKCVHASRRAEGTHR